MTSRLARLVPVLALLAASCSLVGPAPVTLRVAASPELADLRPLLADLTRDTGVTLDLDLTASAAELPPGHDAAWLSSDRYLQLKLAKSAAPKPLSTRTMLSPVVVGVKRGVAAELRSRGPVTWATIADRAAAGGLRFAMADPLRSGSGLVALVGVATAAAGTGRALRLEDVQCDRLRGFHVGNTRTDDEYAAHQGELEGIVAHESVIMALNAGGALAEPLEIIYPADGVVQSEYPLVLLDQDKRAAYDKVVEWLRSAPVQQRIMDTTFRRPINPDVVRPKHFGDTGTALYFPDQSEVIDRLLANYATTRVPGHVIFLLDFSGSMRGDRIDGLRTAFADLTGAGAPTFARFAKGERFTVIRFGGKVLAEQEFGTDPADLAAARDFVGVDSFDGATAIWSTVEHAYDLAATLQRPAVIVLMTDGLTTAGESAAEFLARFPTRATTTRLYALRLGEADLVELSTVASRTGGALVEAAASLPEALKEIRGCI
ncbi:VWA domain-containing protein [Actinokineospora sp. HUAS TT18]|uniref:VWA domain-containing protein n=1 Tax=Actinokineospora sp. HUAS TT18 TaxID=3447451 RepID=UPI003F523BBB